MAHWNSRNPAVKRIVQELKEIKGDDNPDILAEAMEENIFEWHFVIRGAWDSEFEGGIYHGRILMPAEYPFKPPAFVMLTPSGRFETGVKICLSISSHHPESWQPSWSVRSALVALVAFMQTPGNGALGSLDHPTETRRQMAAESRSRPPAYGTPERQQLVAEMHKAMLEMEPHSRQLCKQEQQPEQPAAEAEAAAEGGAAAAVEGEATAAAAGTAPAEQQQQEQARNAALPPAPTTSAAAAVAARPEAAAPSTSAPAAAAAAAAPAVPAVPAAAPLAPAPEPELRQRPAAAPHAPPAAAAAAGPQPFAHARHQQQHQFHQHQPQAGLVPAAAAVSWEDRGLTYLAVVLALCIAALLARKVFVAFTFQSEDIYAFNHVERLDL